RRVAALALPGVERQVMVVAPEGEEGCTVDDVLDLHAQQVSVEADGSLEIGDLQMNVADVGYGRVAGLHPGGTPTLRSCGVKLAPTVTIRLFHASTPRRHQTPSSALTAHPATA